MWNYNFISFDSAVEGINIPAEHMVSKMEEKVIVQETGEAKRNT